MTATNSLTFSLVTASGTGERRIDITEAVIAGWTGRDPEAMEKHIAELAEMGVERPATTPIFYRVGAARLTTADEIQAAGGESSGEVEFVLIQDRDTLLVGVGSDHTDRKVETYSITVSKQMCDKPLAPVLWPFAEVAGHWDRLVLRSHVVDGADRVLYQEGPVAGMLPPLDLIGRYTDGRTGLDDGTAMFCGTLAAVGGIRPAGRFEFELEDPVLGRRIAHGYDIRVLPVL